MAVAQHLPQGRHQAGDRHLNFHETRDNLLARSGPVYGSFASVAAIFALLYLVSQALLFAAEVAVVRQRRLWPRALATSRPTCADMVALTRLAIVQERIPVQRIDVRFDRAVHDDSETDD